MIALFDSRVAYESVDFAAEDPRFSSIAIPQDLSRAVADRKLEFRAGRWCAARALAKLDAPLATFALARDAEGAPGWPREIVGAIAHTRGFAEAAVARASDFAGIGLDVEPIVSREAMREVAAEIAKPSELGALAPAGLDERTLVTLVFSAKESVYKCARRTVGRWFGFHEATLARIENEMFEIAVAPLARTLVGRWTIEAGRVHTAVTLSPTTRA